MEPPLSTTEPPNEPAQPELSERELEVLRLVATGAGNKEIAQRLSISPNTVKVHLRNIFGKIGAASRTEAAMIAVQTGLVQVPAAPQGDQPQALPTVSGQEGLPVRSVSRRRLGLYSGLALGVLAIAALAAVWLWPKAPSQPSAMPPTIPAPTAQPRWQSRAPMLTARSGLAAVTFADKIYAIGGETGAGITNTVEQYDPVTDVWVSLAPLPSAVADVQAAVIGGEIYVPGGREASGHLTSRLEVYDPRADRWESRASLPAALSAYAMVAFEGNLYVFGGWDGEAYLSSVYKYSPDTDGWFRLTAMPTARGFAGAAVAGDKIYVIGGADSAGPVAANEVYIPSEESAGDAWQRGAPLPQGRSRMAVASIADVIHVIGGEGPDSQPTALKYFPQTNEWQAFDLPVPFPWPGVALVPANTFLYAFGGSPSRAPVAQTWAYEAIYTVALPLVK